MKIGKQIAIARKKAGLTQTDVAKKLNLSVSMISAWESGIRIPKLDTIIRICNAIGCDTSEILNTVDFSTNTETEVEEHKLLCPMKRGLRKIVFVTRNVAHGIFHHHKIVRLLLWLHRSADFLVRKKFLKCLF